jgi:hypothetical protein
MTMRKVAVGLSLGLLMLAGCDWSKSITRPRDDGVAVNMPKPEVARLVAYMNDNARRIQTVEATDVQIDCRQDHQSVGVSAMLVCQKPNNFRLRGKVAGNPVIDLGSNDKEFWFWTSQDKPPQVYHCDYTDLRAGGVRLPFPFQPDMIVCALGVAEYDPNKAYKLEVKDHGKLRMLELSEPALSMQNKPITKVTLFNAYQANPPNPQVLGYILRDENGKEICRATVNEVTRDRETQATLPRIVRIDWPAEKIELTMKLYDVHSVRQLEQQRAARLFSRDNLAGYPAVDLARFGRERPDAYSRGTSLQRVSGQALPPR